MSSIPETQEVINYVISNQRKLFKDDLDEHLGENFFKGLKERLDAIDPRLSYTAAYWQRKYHVHEPIDKAKLSLSLNHMVYCLRN